MKAEFTNTIGLSSMCGFVITIANGTRSNASLCMVKPSDIERSFRYKAASSTPLWRGIEQQRGSGGGRDIRTKVDRVNASLGSHNDDRKLIQNFRPLGIQPSERFAE
ncbi:hypothetical protein [Acuticoccus sediminis]|uniref:hypothetical protein n=1 Tax=Acuticoccus sediminis TaxID=2184697 RepID=UPI001390DF91|nr:hypothetical protein [Acuticoccus sediminis]